MFDPNLFAFKIPVLCITKFGTSSACKSRTPLEEGKGTGQHRMKVFLTGGSGFVGRAFIRQLLANGDEVVALSRSKASDANIMQAVSSQTDHFTCMT